MSKNKTPNSNSPKVTDDDKSSKTKTNTDVSKTVLDTPTETTKKDVKFSRKSVDSFLENMESLGLKTEEIKEIKKSFKLIDDKGGITSGQGGGTSKDTEEITKFRKDFGTSVIDVSDGYDVTKTGIKLHYCYDNTGKKRYPTLYLRSEKQVKKDNKK